MKHIYIIICACILLMLLAGCSKTPSPFKENPFDPSVDATGLATLIDSSYQAYASTYVWAYTLRFGINTDQLTNPKLMENVAFWVATRKAPHVFEFNSTGTYTVHQNLLKGSEACLSVAFIDIYGDTSRKIDISCFQVPE